MMNRLNHNKFILAVIFCMTTFASYARYENVSLGTVSWSGYTEWRSSSEPFSNAYIEAKLLEKARATYPGYANYSVTIIHNSKQHESKNAPYEKTGDPFLDGYNSTKMLFRYIHNATGQVYAEKWVEDPQPVIIPISKSPQPKKEKMSESTAIEKAINKAMEPISSGTRVAINTILTGDGLKRDQIKDIILDALLESNYKVVAKEYLEKLKEEIEEQQSGEYNSRTTVKTDNFSAVGYFIDVKIKNNVARVYLINVSTGEYASTANQGFE